MSERLSCEKCGSASLTHDGKSWCATYGCHPASVDVDVDAKCKELASYMAPHLDDANIEALAAFIRDSIECWLGADDFPRRASNYGAGVTIPDDFM